MSLRLLIFEVAVRWFECSGGGRLLVNEGCLFSAANGHFVYLASVRSAKTVLAQFPKWFKENNENHPHKGLKNALAASVSANTASLAISVQLDGGNYIGLPRP